MLTCSVQDPGGPMSFWFSSAGNIVFTLKYADFFGTWRHLLFSLLRRTDWFRGVVWRNGRFVVASRPMFVLFRRSSKQLVLVGSGTRECFTFNRRYNECFRRPFTTNDGFQPIVSSGVHFTRVCSLRPCASFLHVRRSAYSRKHRRTALG